MPDLRFTILRQLGLAGSWGKDTVRREHFGDVLNVSLRAYGAQLVLETYCEDMITRLFLRQLEKVLIFRHTFLSLTGGSQRTFRTKLDKVLIFRDSRESQLTFLMFIFYSIFIRLISV